MSYLINSSFGPKGMERATIPFILACSAANTATTKVFLTGDALNLVIKGKADGLAAQGYTPVKDYIDEFVVKGGRILICRVCAGVMGVGDDDLVEGAALGGAPDTIAFLETGAKVLH